MSLRVNTAAVPPYDIDIAGWEKAIGICFNKLRLREGR